MLDALCALLDTIVDRGLAGLIGGFFTNDRAAKLALSLQYKQRLLAGFRLRDITFNEIVDNFRPNSAGVDFS
jgi:hypothetical protein